MRDITLVPAMTIASPTVVSDFRTADGDHGQQSAVCGQRRAVDGGCGLRRAGRARPTAEDAV